MPPRAGALGHPARIPLRLFLQLAGAGGYAAGNGLAVWWSAAVASGTGAAALWNATEALLAREAPRGAALPGNGAVPDVARGLRSPSDLSCRRCWGWADAGLVDRCRVVAACCVIALAIHCTRDRAPTAHPERDWHRLRTMPAMAGIALTGGGGFEAGLSSVSAAYASATA